MEDEKPILGYYKLRGIPYWIDNFVKLTETKAILKHIARLKKDENFFGNSIDEKGRVEMLEEVLWDMWQSLTKISIHHTEASKSGFVDEASVKLTLLDGFLGENKWAVGDRITYPDFLMYEVVYYYQKFNPNLLVPFPRCVSYLKRFEAIPVINKYMNSERFISGPCFSYKFKSKL